VTFDSITRRLQWLSALGVKKVNLSGGEPTIRADLPDIVRMVRHLGLVCAMTTNGIRMPDPVVASLRSADARVKVSVHGPAPLHDWMLGLTCFEKVDRNVQRLRDAGVSVAIQTVLTKRDPDVYEWLIDYCLRLGLGKLRFVPFVPRGRGILSADDYQMSFAERDRVMARIRQAQLEYRGRLDVDVLDFWTQEYFVLETDGQLQIQRETDAADTTVARLSEIPVALA
jgi:molybdenum cofactor biosynthesis enzyme MoaA